MDGFLAVKADAVQQKCSVLTRKCSVLILMWRIFVFSFLAFSPVAGPSQVHPICACGAGTRSVKHRPAGWTAAASVVELFCISFIWGGMCFVHVHMCVCECGRVYVFLCVFVRVCC